MYISWREKTHTPSSPTNMFYDPKILKHIVVGLRTERDAQTIMRIMIERTQLAYLHLSSTSNNRGRWKKMFNAEHVRDSVFHLAKVADRMFYSVSWSRSSAMRLLVSG